MKTLNVQYQGFKLGLREQVANSLALSCDVHNKADVDVLHALNNLVNNDQLFSECEIFGINNQIVGVK